jgi:prolyl-tRNA synthetase
VAVFQKINPPEDELKPLKKVSTPEISTISGLTGFLNVPPSKTAKAVFYIAELQGEGEPLLIFSLVRGDMTSNEFKLSHAISSAGQGTITNLRPAHDEEIQAVGAVPGYASPIGIKRDNVLVVLDDLVLKSPNLVSGANEPGYHLLNTNAGRDYEPDVVADIVLAEDGALCAHCKGKLHLHRGVEVGNIFKLGSHYSEAVGATYLDEDGKAQAVIMGSYGIGVGRLLACVAEAHHDEHGLIWPVSIAPYPVHLVLLPSKDGRAEEAAEMLYQDLLQAGIEPLFDDRDERAGVKFNDADLIGLPLRVTVSKRSLESGGVEFKRRDQNERMIVPLDQAIEVIQVELKTLAQEIKERFNL